MLSTTKYVYPLETKPFNWQVKRQLDDFAWLRQTLSTNFPGVYLPPSPPKRYRNTNESQHKQQYFLEKFINCILRNPLLRRSTYLVSFLMENDLKAFQAEKKKSSKEKKQTKLEDYWTLDGTLICDPFNDESEKVATNEFLTLTTTVKKKIKRQSDALINALKEVANAVREISKSYEFLENIQNFIPEVNIK